MLGVGGGGAAGGGARPVVNKKKNDDSGGFISVVYARTVYENFSFFSGENFSYVLLDQIY